MKPLVALKIYVLNVLIGFDQFVNAIFGGHPDETISSRCARNYNKNWFWHYMGNFLKWLDKDHLVTAVESERYKKHFPPEFRAQSPPPNAPVA